MAERASLQFAVLETLLKVSRPDQVVVPKLAHQGHGIRLVHGYWLKAIKKLSILEINDVVDYLPDQLSPAKQQLLKKRINEVGGY